MTPLTHTSLKLSLHLISNVFSSIPGNNDISQNWIHDSPTGTGIYFDQYSRSDLFAGNILTNLNRCLKVRGQ